MQLDGGQVSGTSLPDYLRRISNRDRAEGDEKFKALCSKVAEEYESLLGRGELLQRLLFRGYQSMGYNRRKLMYKAAIPFCVISDNKIVLAKPDASSLRSIRWKKNKSLRNLYTLLRRTFDRETDKYRIEFYRVYEENCSLEKKLICSNA